MSSTDRTATDLREWEETAASFTANAPDLPHAEIPRAALEKLTDELRKLGLEQKLRQSQKQEASRRMAEIHAEGGKLATVLRVMARQHYGNRSEKLVELGIQPLRRRARNAAPQTEPPPTPAPTPAVPTTSTSPAAK